LALVRLDRTPAFFWPLASPAGHICWHKLASINSGVRMSPAMAARVTDRLWDIGDIVKLIEEWEAQT